MTKMKIIFYILSIPFRVAFSVFIPLLALEMKRQYGEISYVDHCKEGLEAAWLN